MDIIIKKYLFLFHFWFFAFLPFSTFSQNANIDSLRLKLSTVAEDTHKVNLLNNLAWKLQNLKPDSSLLLSSTALRLAKVLKHDRGIGRSLNQLAVFYRLTGNHEMSLEFFRKAFAVYNKINDEIAKANIITGIGNLYAMQGEYPKSLKFYLNALQLLEKNNDLRGKAVCLGNICITFRNLGEYKKAIKYSEEGIALATQLGDSILIANQTGNHGTLYFLMGDTTNALKFYYDALHIAQKTNNFRLISYKLSDIGGIYETRGEFKKAIFYISNALEMARKLNDENEIARHLSNIGSCYARVNKTDSAKYFLVDAYSISLKLKAMEFQKSSLESLSYLLYSIGDTAYAHADFPKAFINFKQSLNYHEKFSEIKDSLRNEDNNRTIGRLEMKHEMEISAIKKKDAQARKQRAKKESILRRDRLQYSAILIFVVSLFISTLLIKKIKVPIRLAEGFIFLCFVFLFEFFLVFFEPFIDKVSGGEPALKWLFNVFIAALIIPFHGLAEKKLMLKLYGIIRHEKKNNYNENKPISGNSDLLSVKKGAKNNLGFFWFFTFFISLGSFFSFYMDSIYHQNNQKVTERKDTVYVKNLIQSARENHRTDPMGAIELLFKAIKEAKQIKWESGLDDALFRLSSIYNMTGDYSNALIYANKTFLIRKKLNDKRKMAAVFELFGKIYYNQGDYLKCLNYFFNSVKIYNIIGNKKGVASGYGNIGSVYRELKKYSLALDYFLKSLKMNEELNSQENIAISFGNIGITYNEQGKYTLALQYYFKALNIGTVLNDKLRMAVQLGNIGSAYSDQGDSSLVKGDTAFAIRNKYPLALEYYLKSIVYAKELDAKNGLAINLGNIGSLYLSMKNYKSAEKYLTESYTLSKELGSMEISLQTEKNLSTLHALQGEDYSKQKKFRESSSLFKKSILHYKNFLLYKDSIFNDNNSRELGKLEMKHEMEMETIKTKHENSERKRIMLAATNRKNQIQYVGIFIILIITIAGIIFSAKRKLSLKLLNGLLFFLFLLAFQFFLLLADPMINQITNGIPVYKLLVNVLFATLLAPLQLSAERKIRKYL